MALSSSSEDSRIYHNARVLVALRKCIKDLREFYTALNNSGSSPFVPGQPHHRYFPYPTSFIAEDGTLTRFRYLSPLENHPLCITYLAAITEQKGKTCAGDNKVVIKFVARYGKDVHEFLAKRGWAPTLRYYGQLRDTMPSDHFPELSQSTPPGPRSEVMRMVVMDYIVPKQQPELKKAREQIKEVLALLHTNGYIFGDLRWPNIIIDANDKVKFIDFNWCGRYDRTIRDKELPDGLQKEIDENMGRAQVGDGPYAYYPLSISTAENMWASGMEALAQIRPEHDWMMFEKLWT
jgi:hypothetical protein